MITVYCFTFSNGKKYIGITCDFQRRLSAHLSISKNKPNRMLVTKAINKYKTFEITILNKVEDLKLAQKLEKQYIIKFNTVKNGYNQTLGGEGSLGYKHTEITKLKISKFSKQRTRTLEERQKLSKSRRSLNIKMSDESKKLISISKGAKPFKAINLKTKEVFNFFSIVECSRALNLMHSHVSSCLHGKRTTHKGYSFEY